MLNPGFRIKISIPLKKLHFFHSSFWLDFTVPHMQQLTRTGLCSGQGRVRTPLLLSFPAVLPPPGRARAGSAAVTAPAKATRCPRVAAACPQQLRPARGLLRLTKIAQVYMISYENKTLQNHTRHQEKSLNQS